MTSARHKRSSSRLHKYRHKLLLPRRLRKPIAILTAIIVSAISIPIATLYVYAFTITLPPDPALAEISPVVDRGGSQVGQLASGSQKLIEPDLLPGNLVHAVLAAEDHKYYRHSAVSWLSLIGSTIDNLKEGSLVRGGSTITQQYVKNAYLHDPDRSFGRKIKESAIGIKLERTLDDTLGSKTAAKNHILANYLNSIYYGHGLVGADAAAHYYFGRAPEHLNAVQAATIAGIIRAPTIYQQRTSNLPLAASLADATEIARNDPKRQYDTVLRRNDVLSEMSKNGWLPPGSDLASLQASPLGLVPDSLANATDGVNICLLEKVRETVRRELGDAAIVRGGLKIELTVDNHLQQAARVAVAAHRPSPTALAGLVAIDPQTGAVRAVYDNCDLDNQYNIAFDAQRQIASTIKPFIVAAALTHDRPLPNAIDTPACYTTLGTKICNDDLKPRLQLDAATAMAQSNNPYWVRFATSNLGLATVLAQLDAQGAVNGDIPSQPPGACPLVPALAIGACERSVLQLASAYGTWANRGAHAEPFLVNRVTDTIGSHVHYQHSVTQNAALDPAQADAISRLLEGVISRTDGTAHTTAQIGRPAAGKTGTSSNNADAWFVGYTPVPAPGSGQASKALVAAVWVGYDSHQSIDTPSTDTAGGTIAAPIWRDFMISALTGEPVVPFR